MSLGEERAKLMELRMSGGIKKSYTVIGRDDDYLVLKQKFWFLMVSELVAACMLQIPDVPLKQG